MSNLLRILHRPLRVAVLGLLLWVGLWTGVWGGWSTPPLLHGAEDARITIPAEVLETLLKDLAPHPLPPVKGLQGGLFLQNVENLQLADGRLSADVQLEGRKVRYTMALGGSGVVLNVGNVSLPIHVDLDLQLDQPGQKVILRPALRLRSQTPGEGPGLQPLMDLLGRESYIIDPAPYLSPLLPTGDATARLNITLTDLFIAKNKLFISFQPRIQTGE